MKHRIFCILITLILLLGLAACGETGGGEKTPEGDESVSNWQEQYDLGMQLLSEGNYEEAIDGFTAAIGTDPQQAALYSGRAQAWVLSGETTENLAAALADFQTALELDETLADAWLGLADVHIRMGAYDDALEILRFGLAKTGSNPSIADKIAEMESGNITDSSNRLRRENAYDGEGNLIWYRVFTYTGQGPDGSVTSYDAAGNQTGYAVREYDSNGYATALEGWDHVTGAVSQFTYERDADGNTIRSTHYTEAGKVDYYTIDTYDDAGNAVRNETFGPDGSSRYFTLNEYNANGNCTKSSNFYPDGSLMNYQEMEFDQAGRKTKHNYYDAGGTLTQYTITEYNAFGPTLKCVYNSDGSLKRKTVYTYNEQGEPTGSETSDGVSAAGSEG